MTHPLTLQHEHLQQRPVELLTCLNWSTETLEIITCFILSGTRMLVSDFRYWCSDVVTHSVTISHPVPGREGVTTGGTAWKPHWAVPQWWSWPTKWRQYQSQQKQRDAGSEICSSTKKLNTLKIKWTIEESRQRQRWIYNFYQEKCVNEGKTIWAHISLFQHSQASALGAKNSNTISSPFSLLYITNAKRKEK